MGAFSRVESIFDPNEKYKNARAVHVKLTKLTNQSREKPNQQKMSQSVLTDILSQFVTDDRPVDEIIAEFKEDRVGGTATVYAFCEVDSNFEPIFDRFWYLGIVKKLLVKLNSFSSRSYDDEVGETIRRSYTIKIKYCEM